MKIPEPKGKAPKKRRGGGDGLPEPEIGGDFDPFLKAEHIGDEGDTGVISVTGPPVESESEFSDMTLPVTYKGKPYAMGLKVAGGNYARLFKRFGKNPKKWRGKVNVEIKHFKNNDYVAVV